MRQPANSYQRWNETFELNPLRDFSWDPEIGHDKRILSGFSLNLDVISATVAAQWDASQDSSYYCPLASQGLAHWKNMVDFTTWAPKY